MCLRYATVALGVLGGVAIGLGVLKCTLAKLKREETKRRGYSSEEMKGVDNYDPGEDEN